MNAFLNFLNNLKYRNFFFYIIPISTAIVWGYKNQEKVYEDFYEGLSHLLFHLVGIYFIGGVWFVTYISYMERQTARSNKSEVKSQGSGKHYDFIIYQKTVFVAWVFAMINMLLELV